MTKQQKTRIDILNRKARYDYEILSTLSAGVAFDGGEVKSIRMGRAHLKEAYIVSINGELWIKNMHIAAWHQEADPIRLRKLLVRRDERNRLHKQSEERGLTLIPLRLYESKKGWFKLEIAVGRGKKKHDKRATIKQRDIDRRLRKIH